MWNGIYASVMLKSWFGEKIEADVILKLIIEECELLKLHFLPHLLSYNFTISPTKDPITEQLLLQPPSYLLLSLPCLPHP